MDAVRRYVMTLAAAAMLCALVKAIAPGHKGQEKILSLVCGIFLLATALGPLGLLRLPELSDPTAQARVEAGQAAERAEEEAKQQMTAYRRRQSHIFWTKPVISVWSWRCRWSWMKICCPGASACRERSLPTPKAV